MKAAKLPRWWGVKVFTDNIVIGFPIWSGDGEGEFGSIVFTIGQYQYAMAKAGFFVRGGLTLGPLFMDENTAFGPAIIEAYEVEQNRARDPRIVLADGVRDLVLSHTKYYAEPFDSPQNRKVVEDSDGALFVNYLDESNMEFSEGEQMDWDGIRRHKEQIEANLSRWCNNPRIWSKYLWLANYHDWFLTIYEDLPDYSKDLKIDSSLAKTHPSRLIKERKLDPTADCHPEPCPPQKPNHPRRR
jgi:hypothetical protein